ncbi:L-serine ammonia-lyase [Gluconacetobacter asukensis]|uniref:L-serine dehydratase n=1 Tax=Gluconacetobacter asukensis TaxID=1017181 RepID=A0A7W4NZB3_9PROT|nr:L-serine ammonia-lyase [Gluconacetobacter asukensis]MBB2171449.1 L-serine ammonia-lyase [Gluconacetobacter asukensis]
MISLFDLFKIGIGPSSSHTVGPMRAARRFIAHLDPAMPVARLRVTLYGSLAWTASGHATDKAVILGLAGETPESVDPDAADDIVRTIGTDRTVLVHGRPVAFDPAHDIVLDRDTIPPVHPNTMQFQALSADGTVLDTARFCSVGGGFIVPEDATKQAGYAQPDMKLDFTSGIELLDRTRESGLSIAGIVLANEASLRPHAEITAYLDRIIDTMMACVERGLVQHGTLPGRIKVRRRAAALHERLQERARLNQRPPHEAMDWVSLFAIAVNEENAAGGRVVTAPTNGAAGVIPAVLRYYRDFCPDASRQGMHDFLLTAAAVGGLFKLNASISGAEVGCQGEVGVASSMAAAGLAAALGATPLQIENAAEIGMEHHLGMTCDPVAGLVQIPCIERNAFGAVKAINAASLAMHGDGAHHVSLDQVIRTMAETGRDMNHRYKETALGGLAVNFPEC